MADPSPTGPGLRALVVDDHRIFAGALASRLGAEDDFAVVRVAEGGQVARRRLIRELRPDVVLFDVQGDAGPTGTEVLLDLEATGCLAVPLVVSGSEDPHDVVAALGHGVRGWVVKDAPFAELLQAIRAVLDGFIWLPSRLITPILHELIPHRGQRAPTFVDDLSPRQREVLTLLLEGLSRDEIAARMVVSPHTVRTHIQHLLRRSQSHSMLEMLAKARAPRSAPERPLALR